MVMVTGLPMQGWTRSNMERIGNVWGRVVQIEEEEGGHYNYFRVQIVAGIGPTICAIANVVIGEEKFCIFIREDEERNYEPCHCRINTIGAKEQQVGCRNIQLEEVINRNEKEASVTYENGRQVVDTQDAAAVAEEAVPSEMEAEESKVGETQPVARIEDGDTTDGVENASPEMGLAEIDVGPSPTRTKSLLDDRRTEEVIQESGETLYQRPNPN
ncbi:hypothetical protein PIB30_052167 [Stylosanthes scabra]|uniref:DUF4283 domain-containing protein n=1 Tax=Stylosanthes scabra TaxID=79078 RepID=A0ABU6QIH2_9FABA|nr:hypothetical protein [Stylosanthes scabra]